jgi:hypothetical protein
MLADVGWCAESTLVEVSDQNLMKTYILRLTKSELDASTWNDILFI